MANTRGSVVLEEITFEQIKNDYEKWDNMYCRIFFSDESRKEGIFKHNYYNGFILTKPKPNTTYILIDKEYQNEPGCIAFIGGGKREPFIFDLNNPETYKDFKPYVGRL